MGNKVRESCFSSDGYIINQDRASDFPYGKFRTPYNGCGWIAVYNILHYLGHDIPPQRVAADMSHLLHFGGFLGTSLKSMEKALAMYGVKPKLRLFSRSQAYKYKNLPWGILRYFESPYIHFVAFVPYKGEFRFFNCEYGEEAHIMPLSDFLGKYSKFPLVHVITSAK